jgi:hypothetical protein
VVGIWFTKLESDPPDFSKFPVPDKNCGIDAAVNSPVAIKESRISVLAYWLAFAAF